MQRPTTTTTQAATRLALSAAASALFTLAPTATAQCLCMCANDIPDCVDSGSTLWDCVGDFIAYGCGGSSDCCWAPGSPQLTLDAASPVIYMKYKLTNVLISSYSLNPNEGGPLEDFEIKFTLIEYTDVVVGIDAAGNPIIETVQKAIPVPCEFDPATGKGKLILEFPSASDKATPKLLEAAVKGKVLPASTHTFIILPACDGDINADGFIDATDLNLVLADFGNGPAGDTNGDNKTNAADLNAVLAQFGTSCN